MHWLDLWSTTLSILENVPTENVLCMLEKYVYSAATMWKVLHMSVAAPGGAVVKNLPPMQEARELRVWSLDGENPWSRIQPLAPVFLPRKLHRQRSLVEYSSWGCKESDMTDWLNTHIMSVKCISSNILFQVQFSLLIFCLNDLSTVEYGVLKSSTTIVLSSIFIFRFALFI